MVHFIAGIYFVISMGLTSVSVILTVCVLKCHHGGTRGRRVPGWVKRLVLDGSSPLICCCCTEQEDHPKLNRYGHVGTRLVNHGIGNAKTELRPDINPCIHNDDDVHDIQQHPNIDPFKYHEAKLRLGLLRDISKELERLVNKNERTSSDDDITNEWQTVAVAIDRMLFRIFFGLTATATITLLLVIPMFQFSLND